MSLIVDGLQLQDRAGGVYFDMPVGRHDLPLARVATSSVPFRAGLRGERSFADRRRIELESRVLAIADAVAHQAFIDDLKRRLDPSRGEPLLVRDLLPTGLERWCYAWSRALDVERVGGRTATPMHQASVVLEALDPFWYGTYGLSALDSGLLLDDGEALDQGGEIVVAPTSTTHALSFDTQGTADVERIRLRLSGPSVAGPGIEVDTPAGVVGFVMADALADGELLEIDNFERSTLLGAAVARQHMSLRPANRNGEYVRFLPGLNTVRILGQPAEVRILLTPTYL